MSATIYVRNSKIVIPVEELGEALRQIHFFEVTAGLFDTRNAGDGPDALKQLDMLTGVTPPRSDASMTIEFLRLIADHRVSGGVSQQEVMRVLGVVHSKGIGSKTAVVNRIIDGAGFATVDVYSNPRDATGARNWKAGPELDQAIDALISGTRRRAKREPLDEAQIKKESDDGEL